MTTGHGVCEVMSGYRHVDTAKVTLRESRVRDSRVASGTVGYLKIATPPKRI